MKDLHILVCCHKPDRVVDNPPYYPIHVGKANSAHTLPCPGDDEGENISEKNPTFCECTGLYWAWKNLHDVQAVGLCHYRRYFDFHGQGKLFLPTVEWKVSDIDRLNYDIPDKVVEQIKAGKIILSKPESFPCSIGMHYALYHSSNDWQTLERIITKLSGSIYAQAFQTLSRKSNQLSLYNMFIMRKDDFDTYCSWLFPILFEVEKQIDITAYSPYQRRIFGFMAERLMNVWIIANQKEVIHYPVITLRDTPYKQSRLKYWISRTGNQLLINLGKHLGWSSMWNSRID